ncbi:MAG TPA: MFS transporter [Bryobacteraceae bacterium]|nr:MFS transporter [Bryobacteraceae bacterium]
MKKGLSAGRRERWGWYLYDWANAPFHTSVVTVFLGPYLTVIAKAAADAGGLVHPFGIPVDARSLWSYTIGISVAAQVLILPLAGAVADYGRRKRETLAAAAFLGAGATMAMFFLRGGHYLPGGGLFVVANVAYGASIVVFNSFLPQIAAPEQRDDVSSRGWAFGYLGGGLLLALNLLLYLNASKIQIPEGLAVRLSLGSAGAWWALFTIPTILALRNRGKARELAPGRSAASAVVRQLLQTLSQMRRYPETLKFLVAYLLYNDAIQTVIALATQFGSDELKIPVAQLTGTILMVQLVAFFGAIGFGAAARAIGAKRAIAASLAIWIGVLIYVYASVKGAGQFFFAAAAIAVVLGGSQALSRSLYAQLVPKGKEAEYYGLYGISDKGTSWLCPIIFGLALQFTGSYRLAILSLILFFGAGLMVLLEVDVQKGEKEVGVAAEGLPSRDSP